MALVSQLRRLEPILNNNNNNNVRDLDKYAIIYTKLQKHAELQVKITGLHVWTETFFAYQNNHKHSHYHQTYET